MTGDGFRMRALHSVFVSHRVLHYQQVRFGDRPSISQERIMLHLVLDSGTNLRSK